MSERITEQELQLIKDTGAKQAAAKLQAEKFVALSKIADLEYDNLVMQIYNKYSLKLNQDNVMGTGEIIRKQDVLPVPMAAAPVEPVEHLEPLVEKNEGDVNG